MTVVAQAGTAGCRRVIDYRNPAVSGRATTPATGEWVWEQIGGRCVADEVQHAQTVLATCDLIATSESMYTEVMDNEGWYDFVGAYS